MPQLDVSFMTMDPMLADTFSVTRRKDVISNKGRTLPTEETVFPDLLGVVTQQDPSDLMRRDDGQMVPRLIFVASKFAFRNASVGYQPDIITWQGTQYTVKQAYPYSQYGAGVHEAVAESMNAMDQPNGTNAGGATCPPLTWPPA